MLLVKSTLPLHLVFLNLFKVNMYPSIDYQNKRSLYSRHSKNRTHKGKFPINTEYSTCTVHNHLLNISPTHTLFTFKCPFTGNYTGDGWQQQQQQTHKRATNSPRFRCQEEECGWLVCFTQGMQLHYLRTSSASSLRDLNKFFVLT